jgi:hypothetical protein
MVATLVLQAGKSVSSFRIATPCPKRAAEAFTRLFSKMPSSQAPMMLEVEQKFPFSDRSRLEERLQQRGFVPVKELTMVDWYFDRFIEDGVTDLEMPLVRRDHWLRYRELNTSDGNGTDGQWQLKRGNKGGNGGGATVYEEIEGIEAVEIAHSVMREQPSTPTSSSSKPEDTAKVGTRTFDGHAIPVLPVPACDVTPFARIVTHRAKWKPHSQQLANDSDEEGSNPIPDLVVDLDTTPDGFAVGEVEAVVEGEDCSIEFAGTNEEAVEAAARNDRAVARARAAIQEFLASLLEDGDGEGNRRPPMGKLEQFLSQNRPRMYQACVESGVIPKRSPPTNA